MLGLCAAYVAYAFGLGNVREVLGVGPHVGDPTVALIQKVRVCMRFQVLQCRRAIYSNESALCVFSCAEGKSTARSAAGHFGCRLRLAALINHVRAVTHRQEVRSEFF